MRMLDNKWALITGSSRGIGQQIALGLAKRKCNIILHAREHKHLEQTLALLQPLNVQTACVFGDLASPAGVDAVIDGVHHAGHPVDILYNNAAIQNAWQEIWQINRETWLNTFQINFFAVVALCNAFAPHMKQRGYGRIINLTSGIRDIPQLAPYSVSKAAVDKYSQDLAAELKGSNVLVNFLDPGWLRTDLGGPNGENAVESVLPGALVPALLEDHGATGCLFRAQDFKALA